MAVKSPSPVACASTIAALLGLAAAPSSQGNEPPAPPPAAQEDVQPLTRVEPVQVERESGEDPLSRTLSREFNEGAWRARLTARDLDERERAYDDVLRRARFDPLARAFLERLAADPASGGLGWTARLALRELGAMPFSIVGLDTDPFAFDTNVERILGDLLDDAPELGFRGADRPRMRVQMLAPPAGPGGIGSAGASTRKGVTIRQGPAGARIVVTHTKNGEEKERAYDGETLEAILEANPKLAAELHLSFEGQPMGFEIRFEVPQESGAWRRLLAPFAYGDRAPHGEDPFGWFHATERSLTEMFSPTRRSEVRTDVLGVRVVKPTPREARDAGIEHGLVVVHVGPGTLADVMGVRAGNILLELFGLPLTHPEEITDRMRARQRHEAIPLRWIDDLGQRQSATWTPDEEPAGGGAR